MGVLLLLGALLWAGSALADTRQYNVDCGFCHGMPPADSTAPDAAQKNPFVGAVPGGHLNHATSERTSCTVCHGDAVSSYPNDHADGVIQFSPAASGAYSRLSPPSVVTLPHAMTPPNALGTCGNMACHRSVTTPAWNSLGSATCSTCHSPLPNAPTTGAHAKHGDCNQCHSRNAGTGKNPNFQHAMTQTGPTGLLVVLASGSYNSTSKACSNVYCHSNGSGGYMVSPAWNAAAGSSSCTTCHPLGSLSGAHSRHVDLTKVPTAYGSTARSTTGGVYNFGCGQCHPTTSANHADGSAQVDLAPLAGDALKGKNNAQASYSGGVCSGVYCHSDGTLDAVTGKVAANGGKSPSSGWNTAYGANLDRCAMCHGNSPSSGSHPTHVLPGIHWNQISSGSSGVITEMGNTATAAHGNPNTATTISCNTCHRGTVTTARNAKNAGNADSANNCASCHTGAGAGAQTPVAIDTLSSLHVDGKVDVVLPSTTVRSKAQLRDRSKPALWTRVSGYKQPARIQTATGAVGAAPASSVSVTLGAAPANGNTLVAVISTRGASANQVSSLAQAGATWTRVVQAANASGTTTEIWYAPNVTGAAAGIVVNLAAAQFAAAVVSEYNGLLTPTSVDVTASASGTSSAAVTGTTATTTTVNELWIGGIGLVDSNYTLAAPTNAFAAVATAASGSAATGSNAKAYALERFVSGAGTASSGGTVSVSSAWSGAVATFKLANLAFYDTATLAATDWSSGTKTCTTACHLGQQSPTWGTPATCTSCHTALP